MILISERSQHAGCPIRCGLIAMHGKGYFLRAGLAFVLFIAGAARAQQMSAVGANSEGTGAKSAFEVDAYQEAPLERFQLDHLNLQVATAGHIADAKDWKFSDVSLLTADKSSVSVSDSMGVIGLP